MTGAQTMLYFREVGRVRDVLKSRGLPFGDVQRHALHLKALGVRKSSKDFTNADLDKVLAALRAIIEPGNLTAQLRALDQPALRNVEARAKCFELLVELGIGKGYDADHADNLRRAYLDTIVKNMTKGAHIDFQTLPDREANAVLRTLQMRRIAQKKAAAKHATPPKPTAADLEAHNCAW